MVATTSEPIRQRTYQLVVSESGRSQNVVYRGRIEDELSKGAGLVHQFIGRSHYDSDNGVIIYRMPDNGFTLEGSIVTPIAEGGRIFHSQDSLPQTDTVGMGYPNREQRETYLKELMEAGI